MGGAGRPQGCARAGDLSDPARCRTVIDTAVAAFGRVDILVSNAAEQHTHDKLEDITDAEWDRTLAVNLSAFFYLTKAALPHMRPGSSIIGTTSVNSDSPTPGLLPYDVTKAGIANMTAALAQLLAPRGIRANSVAPGPIWTPLIPSTMPSEQVESFGSSAPLDRPGQPAEVAGLRPACLRRGQLYLRCPDRHHRRPAHPLKTARRARNHGTRRPDQALRFEMSARMLRGR